MKWWIPSALAAAVLLCVALRLSAGGAAGRAAGYLERVFQADVRLGRTFVGWNLQIELEDVVVREQGEGNASPILRVRRAVVSPDIVSLLLGRPRARDIQLIGASLHGFRGVDGRFNLARWRDRIQSCRASETMGAIPARIFLSDSNLVLDAAPFGEKAPALRVKHVSGLFRRTRDGRMRFHLAGKTLFSEFTARGSFRPCSAGELAAEVQSEAFDFDALKAWLSETPRGNRLLTENTEFGRGELTMKATGNLASPGVEGRASLREMGLSFAFSHGKLRIRNLVAGMGRERARGNGDVDFSRPGRPFRMTFRLENIDLGRLLKKHLPPQFLPQLELNGEIRMHGSLDAGSVVWDGGEIAAGPGIIRLPPLGAPAGAMETTTYKLRRATAKLAVTGNRFLLNDIHVEGAGFSISGSGRVIGGFDPVEGFDARARAHFDLVITTRDGRARFSLDAADGVLRGEMK